MCSQPKWWISCCKECVASEGYRLTVDLAAQTVTTRPASRLPLTSPLHRKHCMLNGLDEIGLTPGARR